MKLGNLLLTTALLFPFGMPASAQDLSKEDQKWLQTVGPILQDDERDVFEKLPAGEREEFKEIFWARRDPDPENISADNAYRRAYEERVEQANRRFRVLGQEGAQTDCGYVFLILGEPADVSQESASVQPGTRAPETWTYKGEVFAGGETTIGFNARCALPPGGGRLKDQLKQLAANDITRPAIGYEVEDGDLVSLADQMPKPSAAESLMTEGRQDFPLEAETKLMMRSPDGGNTYVGGLVRGDAAGLAVREEGGKKVVDVTIAAEAVAEDGSVPQSGTIGIEALVTEDGHFVASWPLSVPPGLYTLKLGVVDPETGKGSTTNLVFKAPDFTGASGIGISNPVMFAEMRQGVTPAAEDAMGALTLGNNQLLPPFGDVYSVDQALQVLVFVYGAQTDGNGAGSIGAVFEIRRGGDVVSRSQEQVFPTPQAVAAVGPVPLASFGPGEYTIRAKIEDKLAGTTHESTARFTVTGAAGSGGGR